MDSKSSNSLLRNSRNNRVNDMTNKLDKQKAAFEEALGVCRDYGLDWRNHIEVIIKDKQVKGYYVIDESFSTEVARLEF